MQHRDKPRPRPPRPADDWALFLDVDGCLVDFADRPDEVSVPAQLRDTFHDRRGASRSHQPFRVQAFSSSEPKPKLPNRDITRSYGPRGASP